MPISNLRRELTIAKVDIMSLEIADWPIPPIQSAHFSIKQVFPADNLL